MIDWMLDCRAAVARFLALSMIALAASVLGTAPLAAQNADSAEARAFLVTPLSFVKEFDLDFGQIIPGATNGEIVMDSTGIISTTGGITVLTGTSQPARFWGYGQFNQRVLINIDQNSYLLTHTNGSDTMVYDRVTIGSQPPIRITTNPRRFRIINPDGFFSFTIAGRLQVASSQEPGEYTGEFTVTLEYE
ncbi:MAG: DUF4402 domain-containing protein [Pseudomonadota bacterium]